MKSMLQQPTVRFIMSCILGFGLATLMRPVVVAAGTFSPPLEEIQNAMYRFGKQCFSVQITPIECDATRKTIAMQPPNAFA